MITNDYLSIVVAVIRNTSGQLLISQRGQQVDQANLWEFPGGKLETGETLQQALERELFEELGISVTQSRAFLQIIHHYPKYSVCLEVFLVTAFTGEARGCEGQPIRWVTVSELANYAFPAANTAILRKLQLSDFYPILEANTEIELWANLQRILTFQPTYLQIRLKNLSDTQRQACLPAVLEICQQAKIQPLLNSTIATDNQQGLHLTSAELMRCTERPPVTGWLAASCHNWQQLQQAERLAVDFAVLSPVLPTATHPQIPALGWELFQQWTKKLTIPVYALGGLTLEQLALAQHYGAQGIAGIRAFIIF